MGRQLFFILKIYAVVFGTIFIVRAAAFLPKTRTPSLIIQKSLVTTPWAVQKHSVTNQIPWGATKKPSLTTQIHRVTTQKPSVSIQIPWEATQKYLVTTQQPPVTTRLPTLIPIRWSPLTTRWPPHHHHQNLGRVDKKTFMFDSSTFRSWRAAMSYCQTESMQLASFDSRSQIDFVIKKLTENRAFGSAWTSGTDMKLPENLTWGSSGTPVDPKLMMGYLPMTNTTKCVALYVTNAESYFVMKDCTTSIPAVICTKL